MMAAKLMYLAVATLLSAQPGQALWCWWNCKPPPQPAPPPAPPTTPPSYPPAEAVCLGGTDGSWDLSKCEGVAVPQTAIDHNARRVAAEDYDPTQVDWRSLSAAIRYLGNKEQRFCNFAIRAFFHDAGAYTKDKGNQYAVDPLASGADGTLLLDKFEFLQPENRYDAFALYVRTVLIQISNFYAASFADMLNVAAFTCAEVLGGSVPIPAQCETDRVGLMVGKLDADLPFSKDKARDRVNHLPGPFQETPFWLNFWLNDLNSVAEPGFTFDVGEALALMGPHTLMDNQACTKEAKTFGIAKWQDYDKPKCWGDGAQRMFKFDNGFFKDVTSGTCEPRKPNPADAQWFVTSLDGAKGRQPNDKEAAQLQACLFKSAEGKALHDDLECQAAKAAQDLGIGAIPEDNDFRFVDWKPNDNTRHPCCGALCHKCTGRFELNEPFYCKDSPRDTSFWFYTWQDCDMVYATRTPVAQYCSGPKDCGLYKGSQAQMAAELKRLGEAYARFTGNSEAWQVEYARGHCKLNNLGALYSKQATPLAPLLDKCFGKIENGRCSTDPDASGVVKKAPACCSGPCPAFELSKVISSKQAGCGSCTAAETAIPEVPEAGTLPTGFGNVIRGLFWFVPPIDY